MTRALVLGAMLFAAVIRADEAVDVARLVIAPAVDAAALTAALQSKDAVTRATAARVALIRDVRALVPQLREALANDPSAEAAREEVRALVLLGDDADVAFAAGELGRFSSGMDAAFADAVARLGAPRAIQLYYSHVAKSRSPRMQWELALWGRSEQLPFAASRALAARDAGAWNNLLAALEHATLPLDPPLALTALRSDKPEIVSATLWYVLRHVATAPDSLPALVAEEALRVREGASDEEAFLRELLRRARGAKPEENKTWIDVAGRDGIRHGLQLDAIERLLTKDERKAAGKDQLPKALKQTLALVPVATAPFRFSIAPPTGLPSRILTEERCRAQWIGAPRATVDRAGRVLSADTKGVFTDSRCQSALRTLLALSLAEPAAIDSPLDSGKLLIAIKSEGRSSCLDEPLVATEHALGALTIGGSVKAPKAKQRVEPLFPASVLSKARGTQLVTLQAVITRAGCVRDIQLISPTPFPELNTSAMVALSQWTFEPGTLDGVPVDVIFMLTISYRH